MKLNKNGFVDDEIVQQSNLPIYSFDDQDGRYMPSDLWTYSDLKEVLKITLTPAERVGLIVAFQKSSKKQKGYSPLYSFHQLVNRRYDMNVKFFPLSDE